MKIEKKYYIWIAVIFIALVLIYVYRNNIYNALGMESSSRQYHGGGHMGGGRHGHGGRGHGGHFRSGWGWGYWYPYYTTSACPTGNCNASDGTIGTWITNADGTCTCRSDKK